MDVDYFESLAGYLDGDPGRMPEELAACYRAAVNTPRIFSLRAKTYSMRRKRDADEMARKVIASLEERRGTATGEPTSNR